MSKKGFDWEKGVNLDDHSKRKHKILREYFRNYLITRCRIPQQEKFRLAMVDGFAGAGRYTDGSPGSPLILIDVLRQTFAEINIERAAHGMRTLAFEVLLICNDFSEDAVGRLRINLAPLLAEITDTEPNLFVTVDFHNQSFDELFPEIKSRIQSQRFGNVLFNLDQEGYTDVRDSVIEDILHTWKSAEVFLTFMIKTLLTYLSTDESKNRARVSNPELMSKIYASLDDEGTVLSKDEFLGNAERLVFENFKQLAPFASPFSIHNPDGWQYWLMHFANSFRARQVYNDILHRNSSMQAHFGRSGLRMLSFNPVNEGTLYLFDEDSRSKARKDLYDDIPRMITDHGDALDVMSFFSAAYSETPAHSDDINEMIIKNPDVEVITASGGERRAPNAIRTDDTLKLKNQTSFFPIFRSAGAPKK